MLTASIALPVIAALLAAFGAWSLLGAFSNQKRSSATTDIERLLGPLASALLRRGGGRDRVKRQLEWAGVGWAPELFVVLPFVLAPAAAIVLASLSALAGMGTSVILLVTGAGAVMGFVWPRTRISGVLRRRKTAIHEDVPVFMSQYARLASTYKSMQQIVQAMAGQVASERLRAQGGGTFGERLRERRYGGAYSSSLWQGLLNLDARKEPPRENADFDAPDAYLDFCLFCDDDDLTKFITNQRLAALRRSQPDPVMIDAAVEELRRTRIQEAERMTAKYAMQALVFLVIFCLPMLFAAILLPILLPILLGPGALSAGAG
jgi:hypothetical protein